MDRCCVGCLDLKRVMGPWELFVLFYSSVRMNLVHNPDERLWSSKLSQATQEHFAAVSQRCSHAHARGATTTSNFKATCQGDAAEP